MTKSTLPAPVGTAIGLLLLLVAAAAVAGTYLPARTERERLETEVARAEARVTRLGERIERLRLDRDALEAGEPATVDEALREVLRKGPRDEFLLQGEAAEPDA